MVTIVVDAAVAATIIVLLVSNLVFQMGLYLQATLNRRDIKWLKEHHDLTATDGGQSDG